MEIMKRYEWFNQISNTVEAPVTQAVGMILAEIQDTFQIEEELSKYIRKFEGIIKWLNEEYIPKD